MSSILKSQIEAKDTIVFSRNIFIKNYKSKVILITGAGTIGEELLKVIYDTNITFIVIDNSEITLFNLKEKNIKYKNIHFILCSIRDKKRLKDVFSTYLPNIVIHTAAYKHVDLSEHNIYESIRTNVEGTVNLFNISTKKNVEQFLFVSTDKAVYPSSLMGKTKKIAELYLESFIGETFTNIKIIRFGNVLNSSGSLIPIVKSKIVGNEDIYIRGKQTKRYFIFPVVVSKSILNLLSITEDGLYMINMGKPIKILDLVNEIITKSKKTSSKIIFSKLLKGEKEEEDLLYKTEELKKTKFKELYKIKKNEVNTSHRKINKLIRCNKKLNILKTEKVLNKIIFESQE